MAKIRVGGLGRLLMIVVIVVVGLVVAFVPALPLPPFVGAGVYGVGGRGVSVSASPAGYVDDPRVVGYGDLDAVGYDGLDAVRYRGLDAVGDRGPDALGYGAGESGRGAGREARRLGEAGPAAGEGPVVGDTFGHPHAAREGCPARRGGRSTGSLCAPAPSGKAVSTAAPVGTVQGGSAISAPKTGRQAVPLSRSGELPVHHLVFRC
ncbi:hypothetical protein [Streptomyces sp. NRRL S-337]|uniref:hypothetical protein n=1 Tax=Streptomyces sp. NRRL S-337 TaxID=1463900 RepID=UPI00068C04CE|nr:hypothetical protein [Streptomyces sp. NRRL S-337]